MSKTVYYQNCCFFEFAILPSFFRLSWQKIWDGFLESWNPSVSKTLQYSMSKNSKILPFGHVEVRHIILKVKYPLQVPIAIMMSLFNEHKMTSRKKYQLNAHTQKKKYSQRTHIKTATNKETSSTAAFVLCRFLLPLWLYARSFLYE